MWLVYRSSPGPQTTIINNQPVIPGLTRRLGGGASLLSLHVAIISTLVMGSTFHVMQAAPSARPVLPH